MKFGPGLRINYPKLVGEMEAKRKAAGLSILKASIECGMATPSNWWFMTARRTGCHADTFIRILDWLGTTDVAPFLMWDDKGDEDW